MKRIFTITLAIAFLFCLSGQKNLSAAIADEGTKTESTLKTESDPPGQDEEDKGKERSRNRRRFTPHFAGFEFGVNDFVNANYTASLPPELSYMDLNSGKSHNININIAQLGIGITRHIGLVTGVGFEFNNYFFDGNNSIQKDEFGVVEEYDAGLDGIELEKSKFSTTYFVVPALLEIQLPLHHRRTLNIAGGMIGGVKMDSRTKMVYHDGGKQKVKEKDDYSLNILRYGPTVRVGYESFQLYATYYMNGLFKDNKGPELYPVQIGIAFTFD